MSTGHHCPERWMRSPPCLCSEDTDPDIITQICDEGKCQAHKGAGVELTVLGCRTRGGEDLGLLLLQINWHKVVPAICLSFCLFIFSFIVATQSYFSFVLRATPRGT